MEALDVSIEAVQGELEFEVTRQKRRAGSRRSMRA